jgi:hypothetical protein
VAHACAKCEANVEDGVPFCKACGAPQIRVAGIEPQPPQLEAHDSSTEGTVLLPELLPQARAARIHWSQAFPCAALGGAFSLLLVIPLSLLSVGSSAAPLLVFGLAFLAGGAWAARLYRRKVKDAVLTPGSGAQLGAASGGFGFLFLAVVVIAMAVYRGDEMRKLMTDSAPQLINRGYDAEKMQQMLDLLKTPGGLAFFVAFGLFAMLVMFVVGSSIGGAWYGGWTRKRLRR